MKPKEKAEELISKYIIVQDEWYLDKLVDGLRIAQAKRCALIAVDEILNLLDEIDFNYHTDSGIKFYIEVKQEITKL
jgi:hypothetical protein